MKKKNDTQSFAHAISGVRYVFYHEKNFRIHVFCAGVVIFLGILFGLLLVEWLFILFAIGFVFVLECLNSAVELLIDVVVPRLQQKAGAAKDVMAGAVLCGAFTAGTIGLAVFLPYVVELFL